MITKDKNDPELHEEEPDESEEESLTESSELNQIPHQGPVATNNPADKEERNRMSFFTWKAKLYPDFWNDLLGYKKDRFKTINTERDLVDQIYVPLMQRMKAPEYQNATTGAPSLFQKMVSAYNHKRNIQHLASAAVEATRNIFHSASIQTASQGMRDHIKDQSKYLLLFLIISFSFQS